MQMKINRDKLELLMANACITKKDLAKKADLSEITVARMKTGKNVKPITIGKIAKALKVKAEDLI